MPNAVGNKNSSEALVGAAPLCDKWVHKPGLKIADAKFIVSQENRTK